MFLRIHYYTKNHYRRYIQCDGYEVHLLTFKNIDDVEPTRDSPMLIWWRNRKCHFLSLKNVEGFDVCYGTK